MIPTTWTLDLDSPHNSARLIRFFQRPNILKINCETL